MIRQAVDPVRGNPRCSERGKIASTPVSYTHLDVYKRQVYFFLLKRLSPVILSFVFIIFPVFAVIIGSWYEGLPISTDLAIYSAILLGGFAITKMPVEKLLVKKA